MVKKRKRFKKLLPLWVSIFLHAIFFALLTYKKVANLPFHDNLGVEVTVVEIPKQLAQDRSSNYQFGKKVHKSGGHSGFRNLMPQYGDLRRDSGSTGGDSDLLTDNVDAPWGSGAGEFKKVTDYNLMSRIHNQIEGLLYYPGVLAAHKVEGTVNVRLVLNDKGSCDWPHTQIASGSQYFRVYILDVLKKFCRQSFAHGVHGRRLTNVDLSFQFAITEHDDQKLKAEQSHIVGNVLMFYRNSHQSIAQWHIGPFTGIFPIPFVQLDFGWLVEHWETYIEHKGPSRVDSLPF